MKPSWDDAPEWAEWLSMDADGLWFWYQCRPVLMSASDGFDIDFWRSSGGKRQEARTDTQVSAESTLEPRP